MQQSSLTIRILARKAKEERRRLRVDLPLKIEGSYSKQLDRVVVAIHGAVRAAVRAGVSPGLAKARARRAASAEIRRIDFGTVARHVDQENLVRVNARIRKLAQGVKVPKGKKLKQAKGSIVNDTRLADASPSAVFVRQNVKLIKGLSEDVIDKIATIIEDNEGQRWEEIAKKIEERVEIGRRRADLIARDQVLNLNADLTRTRHKSLGIEEYTWATAGDGDRVRKNHRELDGKRFRYDDPPMGGGTGPKDKGNPGTGIICRCQDIPVIEDLFV